VDASNEESIKHGITDAAKSACNVKEMSYEDAKLWFGNLEKCWLLILDNADDTTIDYSEFFSSGSNGSILLTTRNEECSIHGTVGSDEFDKLKFDDAVILLLKSAGFEKELWPERSAEAQRLAGDEVLAQHALAITQAGAFIRQGLGKLEEYGAMFERERKRLLTHRPKQAKSIYGDVYATFEVSANAMKDSSDPEWIDALKLLEVLAFLHREGVPEELFTKAWNFGLEVVKKRKEGNVEDQEDDEEDDDKEDDVQMFSLWHVNRLRRVLHESTSPEELDLVALRKARQVLRSFSLIMINPETYDISMHPLVHAWAKDRLRADLQILAWAATASILSLSMRNDYSYREFFNKIQTHVEFCLSLQPQGLFAIDQYPPLEICRMFYSFTWLLYRLRNDDTAEELANILLSRTGREIQPRSWNWRHLKYLLAICQIHSGKYEESMQSLKDVMSFDNEKELGYANSEHLAARQELGYVYGRLDQHQEAIEVLEDVVQIEQQMLAPAHKIRSSSQHALAAAYSNNDQPEKAIELLHEVIQTKEKVLALTHPSLLASQHALARVYADNDQPEKAIELLHKAIQTKEKVLAFTHPSLLASQHELARAYSNNDQPEKAIELLHEVIQTKEKVLAPTHPSLLASQHELARAYYKSGEYQKALPIIQRVVEVEGTILQSDSRSRVLSEDLLADCISAIKGEMATDKGVNAGGNKNATSDVEDPGLPDQVDLIAATSDLQIGTSADTHTLTSGKWKV
jgi:tetratricopeptide (TPR) repeat protein